MRRRVDEDSVPHRRCRARLARRCGGRREHPGQRTPRLVVAAFRHLCLRRAANKEDLVGIFLGPTAETHCQQRRAADDERTSSADNVKTVRCRSPPPHRGRVTSGWGIFGAANEETLFTTQGGRSMPRRKADDERTSKPEGIKAIRRHSPPPCRRLGATEDVSSSARDPSSRRPANIVDDGRRNQGDDQRRHPRLCATKKTM